MTALNGRTSETEIMCDWKDEQRQLDTDLCQCSLRGDYERQEVFVSPEEFNACLLQVIFRDSYIATPYHLTLDMRNQMTWRQIMGKSLLLLLPKLPFLGFRIFPTSFSWSKYITWNHTTLPSSNIPYTAKWAGRDGSGTESRRGEDFPPVQTGPGAQPSLL